MLRDVKARDLTPVSTRHVVRRYGPVGGMERYVWELTRALAAAGHPVTVVCERNHAAEHGGIAVHELGVIAQRPRWLSLLRFSRRVRRWLRAHPQAGALIHSHERLDSHHVTTFHGPPFATIFERGLWRWISLRVWMQLWLERRELCSPGVRAVVPNSPLIQMQLQHYYPELGPRLAEPIAPGVAPGPERPLRSVPQDGGVIGFVGREWKRKGLDLALPIAAELRRCRPRLELWVVGPEPADIRQLFAGWTEGYRLLGWRGDSSIYPHLDLLLHPARAEPYGMVVAEAMAARVPVVLSDQCGIAPEVAPDHGAVVPVCATAGEWALACERQLQRSAPPPPFARSWEQVARDYLTLYRALLAEAGGKPAT
jgi:UDP-glucose:(heptosyl)LPS alpha-1,3-glucosyltransferase